MSLWREPRSNHNKSLVFLCKVQYIYGSSFTYIPGNRSKRWGDFSSLENSQSGSLIPVLRSSL